MTTYYEKAYGLFFGGALGDSIGLGTEFLTRETVKEFYGDRFFKYSEFYPDEFRKWWTAGDWTDDTNQMIIIANIIRYGGLKNLKDKSDIKIQQMFAKDLKDWRSKGHTFLGQTTGVGIGTGVRWVMDEPCFLEDPQQAAKNVWEDTMKSMCEDGCIMRTSFLGLIPGELDFAVRMTRIFCMATHYHPKALACCVAIVAMVYKMAILQSTDIEEIIEFGKNAALVELEKHPDYKKKYKIGFLKYYNLQELEDMKLDYGPYMSHVKKPFKCTIWALRYAKNNINTPDLWKQTIFKIIRMGGDADTNSCMAGSVLGCLVGYMGLPKEYIVELNNKSYLYDLCYYYMRIINNPDGFPANPPNIKIVNKNIEIEVDIYNHSNKIIITLLKNKKYLELTDTVDYWWFGKNIPVKDLEYIMLRQKRFIVNSFEIIKI
jgi:ADP-ribosylglycohydrolase